MATGEPAEVETTGIRDDGGHVPVRIHAFPLIEPDGSVSGFIELVEDITEQKRAEKALRESEALLRNTFDAIPDLLTVHDRDYRVVLSNWHGYESVPAEERQGRPRCFACYRGGDKPCEGCHLPVVFETGKAVVVDHHEPDTGHTKEVSAYPVFDENGQVMLVTECVRDITDRRKAERELKQYAAALESANRTWRRFPRRPGRHPRQERVPGQHEPRNPHPLDGHLGYAEVLLGALSSPTKHRPRPPSSATANTCWPSSTIILDLSKIEAGKLEVERSRLFALPNLRRLASLMSVSAGREGLVAARRAATGRCPKPSSPIPSACGKF